MTADSDAFDDFLGEEVVDAAGHTIGTLACYWEHEPGNPVLLGIDLESAPGTHVIPAKDVQLDTRKSYVVIPFGKEKLRRAPSLECGAELDRSFEERVFHYYGDDSIDYDMEEQPHVPKKRGARVHSVKH
jgi:hypothetical protein